MFVCFWLVGWGGGGFCFRSWFCVSGWLGGACDGGIWRWWVCGGGEVLSVSMLSFAWNIGEVF